jgi:hypothetical protein
MNLKNTEIDLLANDVRENIKQTLEITKFSITASSALIGFGLSGIANQGILSALICLLPIPIIIAAIEMIFDRRSNVMKKATFLRMFGGENYVWELFLRKQRVKHLKEQEEKQKRDIEDSSFTKKNCVVIFIWVLHFFKKIEKHKSDNINGPSFTRTLIRMLKTIAFISIIASTILLLACVFSPNGYYKGTWDPLKILSLFAILLSIACVFYWVVRFFKGIELRIENVIMGGEAEQKMADEWVYIEDEIKNQDSGRLPG